MSAGSAWCRTGHLRHAFLVLTLALQGAVEAADISSPGFNRSIRPLLADRCFRCHGPDAAQRQAGLRLDVRESAVREQDGSAAVRPGDPEHSGLMSRVTATDPAVQMPPPGEGPPLTQQEVGRLRDWIAAGAEYEPHWAYVPPRRAPSPSVHSSDWIRRPLDRWILARLETEGLSPSPQAAAGQLLRRISLDLTGLPPTEDQLEEFLTDTAPEAYERQIERLLASPRFGERLAQFWLDAARYADTNGYFTDEERTMWRWRDGVIAAFNANLPFDEFSVEQLAGDLLPGAGEPQRIASGFNRNHMTNNETGLIDEEWRLSYVMDRLETTGTVWLGLTLNCARCHSHKFDPISQREYYQLLAFFNQVAEQGLVVGTSNSPPLIATPTADQQARLAELKSRQAELQRQWETVEPQAKDGLAVWSEGAVTALPAPPDHGLLARFSFEDDLPAVASVVRTPGQPWTALAAAGPVDHLKFGEGVAGRCLQIDSSAHAVSTQPEAFDWEHTRAFTLGAWVKPATGNAGCILSKMDDDQFLRGFDLFFEKGHLVVHLNHRAEIDAIRVKSTRPIVSEWQHVAVTYDGSGRAAGLRLYVNGEPDVTQIEVDQLRGTIRTSQPLRIGRRSDSLGFQGSIDEVCIFDRVLSPQEIAAWETGEALRAILRQDPTQRTDTQNERLMREFLNRNHPEWASMRQALREQSSRTREFEQKLPTTMVMQELAQKRNTHILTRGQYDQPSEQVAAGVPAVLADTTSWNSGTNDSADRLALARWIVNPQNPLTARVIVNRVWAQLFGTGLVKSVNDLGTQGEWPSHPELLDELALDFMESGWDLKRLFRTLVTSATYRQTSTVTPLLQRRDPENRLLARGPRFRLDAEAVRDQALAVSGLMTQIMGGPGVKPYQPAGLWEAVSYDGDKSYRQDHGENLYRRSLYTFWKRQSPPPAFLAWDGPTRETCLVQRARTNTPLQALVTTNDVTYVEAARVWAGRLLPQDAADEPAEFPRRQLDRAFLQLLCRRPDPVERATLLDMYAEERAAYERDPQAASRWLTTGEFAQVHTAPLTEARRADWAALATVLQVLLNLDETVTKE